MVTCWLMIDTWFDLGYAGLYQAKFQRGHTAEHGLGDESL